MKKKLLYISVAFASIMSYAQQGNVGINTVDPKATVDITKNSANSTNDVEGLLIPRVSKEKAFKMAGNTAIKESTLVYVDELVYTFPAAATDAQKAKVADITENGYYFWNGAKWVKVSGRNGDKDAWVFDANGDVVLNRSGRTISEKYTATQHLIEDDDMTTFSTYSFSNPYNSTPTSVAFDNDRSNTMEFEVYDMSKIVQDNTSRDGATFRKVFTIANGNINSNFKTLIQLNNLLEIDASNNNDYKNLRGSNHSVITQGGGVVNSISGSASSATIFPNSTVNYAHSLIGQISQYSSQDSKDIESVLAYASQRGAGNIRHLTGLKAVVDYKNSGATGNVISMSGVKSQMNLTDDFKGQVENLFGLYVDQNISPTTSGTVVNNHGIHINSITFGDNPFAIYTNAGKVRFGDLPLSTVATDKLVVADADGVLKTKDAASLVSSNALWRKDSDGNIVLENPDSRDKVYYGKKGEYTLTTKDGYESSSSNVRFNPSTGTYDPIASNSTVVPDVTYIKNSLQSQNLFPDDKTSLQKNFSSTALYVTKDDANAGKSFYVDTSWGSVQTGNTNDYNTILVKRNGATHGGEGTVNYLRNRFATTTLAPNSTAKNLSVDYKLMTNFSSNASDYNIVETNRFNPKGTGAINWLTISRNFADLTHVSSAPINVFKLTEDRLEVNDNYTGQITSLRGKDIIFKNTGASTPNVKDMYGLVISSVNWGTDKNYAIYTNSGLVRFGDKVGIGVAVPENALHIQGETYEKASVNVRRIYSSVQAAPAINYEKARGTSAAIDPVVDNDRLGASIYRGYDGSEYINGAMIASRVEGTPSTGVMPASLEFSTRNESESDAVVKMVLTKDGQLGIGTYTVGDNMSIGVKTANTGLEFIDNDGIYLTSKGTSLLNAGLKSIGSINISSDTNQNFSSANGRFEGIKFSTSELERMRITELGNVGIGTITPAEKLEVAGSVKATSFIAASGNTFPDYVFENYYNGESALKPTYNFKSLDQVESFIKTEGHLPGYKSAKEVKQAGQIDMTATQLTNVEKIEELYLHTIEQEKKIDQQAKEIAELKKMLNELLKK